MKEKIRQIGSAIGIALIISTVFSITIWAAEEGNFLKAFFWIFFITLIAMGVLWIVKYTCQRRTKQ